MALETLAIQVTTQHAREETSGIVCEISFEIGNVGFTYSRHLPTYIRRGFSPEQRNLYLKEGPYVECVEVTVQDGSREPFSEIMIQANNYVNRREVCYKRNVDLFVPLSRGKAYCDDLCKDDNVLAQLFAEKWYQADFETDNWYIFRGKYRKVEDLKAFVDSVLNKG